MEYIITAIIVLLVVFIIVKNIRSSAKGHCNCTNCNANCSKRKDNLK